MLDPVLQKIVTTPQSDAHIPRWSGFLRPARIGRTLLVAVFKGASWIGYWQWIRLRRLFGSTASQLRTKAGPHPTGGATCVGPVQKAGTTESHFLTQEQADQFEADGFLPPFPLLSPEQAADLLAEMRSEIIPENLLVGHEVRDFFGSRTFDRRVAQGGLQGIHGHWQHLRLKSLADVLRRPELTHRLASILGEDLICWRSQFFERLPGAEGTAWHQASTFREGAQGQKLTPTVDLGCRPIQLTAWLALTDCTVENGCLRILRGSHHDSYIVDREADLVDDPARSMGEFASRISLKKQIALARTLAAPSPFPKSKFLIENIVLKERPQFFDSYEAIDFEMKAGEIVIFTSLAVHGSHANQTQDQSRVGFASRITTNDVQVFGGQEFDMTPPVLGKEFRVSLDSVGCVQILGEDHHHLNKILPMPSSPASK